jgi:hypothetical protein
VKPQSRTARPQGAERQARGASIRGDELRMLRELELHEELDEWRESNQPFHSKDQKKRIDANCADPSDSAIKGGCSAGGESMKITVTQSWKRA